MKFSEITIFVLGLTLVFTLPLSVFGQTIPTFQESEGLVIIEIESAPEYGNWEARTGISGFLRFLYSR